MKNSVKRILALILCLTVLYSGSAVSVSAADTEEDIASQAGDVIVKGFYNTLNTVVELLVKVICTLYPNPKGWQDIENYSREEIGFLEGRDTYQTEAGADNK